MSQNNRLLVEVIKHLAGKHDQRKHRPRGATTRYVHGTTADSTPDILKNGLRIGAFVIDAESDDFNPKAGDERDLHIVRGHEPLWAAVEHVLLKDGRVDGKTRLDVISINDEAAEKADLTPDEELVAGGSKTAFITNEYIPAAGIKGVKRFALTEIGIKMINGEYKLELETGRFPKGKVGSDEAERSLAMNAVNNAMYHLSHLNNITPGQAIASMFIETDEK